MTGFGFGYAYGKFEQDGSAGGGAAGVDWDPLLALGWNLKGWYDSSDSATIPASGAVTTWTDKSQHGYNLSQASASKKPTVDTTNLLNSYPGVAYDATDDGMATTTMPAMADRVSYVHLFRLGNPGTSGVLHQSAAGDAIKHATYPYHQLAPNANRPLQYSGVTQYMAGAGLTQNANYIFSEVYFGTASKFAINGAALSAGGNTGSNNPTGYGHGDIALATTAVGSTIYVGAVIDKIMTQEEFYLFEGYLAHKFDQATILDAAHPYKAAMPELPSKRLVLTDVYENSTDAASFNTGAKNISVAASDRKVIVSIGATANAGGMDVSAVTIGGIAATKMAEFSTGVSDMEFWWADVPTGTTAAVDVTLTNTANHIGIGVWAAYGLTGSVTDSDGFACGTGAVSSWPAVSTVDGGFLIAAAQIPNFGAGNGFTQSSAFSTLFARTTQGASAHIAGQQKTTGANVTISGFFEVNGNSPGCVVSFT